MSFAHKLQLRLRGPMRPVVRFLGFFVYNTHFIDGSADLVTIGKRVGLANTLFNTASGRITVGDHCAFGYNVMLLTGRHRFDSGRRVSLQQGSAAGWGGDDNEVPPTGYDIVIGEGCWIASGAIISGGVTIGPNSIVAAGAVVTKSVPAHSIVAGVPAVVIGDTRQQHIGPNT